MTDPEILLLDAVVDIRNQVLDDILNMVDTSIQFRSDAIRELSADDAIRDQYICEWTLLRNMYRTISKMKWEEQGEDSD